MSIEQQPLAKAACYIVDLAEKLNVFNISNLPGAWIYSWTAKCGKAWTVAANGHNKPMPLPAWTGGFELEPFHFFVWRNEFPFGILTAFDGVFLAGHESSEDEFIAAIQAHIKEIPSI